MKLRFVILLAALLALAGRMWADVPFREHRADHFYTLPIAEDNIVFIGNSITNMHEWREAFNDPKVLNRGISGAISDEVVHHLGAYIAGQPRKIFLMIGTNDLGTPGLNTPTHPFENIRKMVVRIQKECPKSELYVQSILPSNSRKAEDIIQTNAMIRELCEKRHITYIDLWSLFVTPGTQRINPLYTYDGLHPTAMGYRVWCKAIEKYVGKSCVYPEIKENESNGVGGSNGMRITSFGALPVGSKDILMVGDEVQHGGEWAELLQSARVKSRGIGWGYSGADIATVNRATDLIFKGNAHQQAPAKVFLYTGTADVNGTQSLEAIAQAYRTLVKKVHRLAPSSAIYIEALLPHTDAQHNRTRVLPMNEKLKQIAAEEGVEFVDLYTPFAQNGRTNATYFSGVYLNGKGYVKLAALLAPLMGEEMHPLTMEAAQKNYELNRLKVALQSLIDEGKALRPGGLVGQYPLPEIRTLFQLINTAKTHMSDPEVTAAVLESDIQQLKKHYDVMRPHIGSPMMSVDGHDFWYTFQSVHRLQRYVASKGMGKTVYGDVSGEYAEAMWKFEPRPDDTYNIVNRKDGAYLNPECDFNKVVCTMEREPRRGWKLSYADELGLYIVTSGTTQLNQTFLAGAPIYNWSSHQDGCDRADAGCQFLIAPAGTPKVEESDPNFPAVLDLSELTPGWYRVRVAKGSDATMQQLVKEQACDLLNAEEEYRQTAAFYYPLKMGKALPNRPATAYFYLDREGEGFRWRGLNGHGVAENCTATTDTTVFAIPIAEAGRATFSIGHWSYFAPNDGAESPYVGKSSASHHTFRFAKVSEGTLLAMDCYRVKMEGMPAVAEVGKNVSLTLDSDVNLGIRKVYDGGYFFVKKAIPLSAKDFRLEGVAANDYDIVIKDFLIIVRKKTSPTAWEKQMNLAQALLAQEGVGYPSEISKKRLRAAISTAEKCEDRAEALSLLKTAISSYVTSKDVQMPIPGRAYAFINVHRNGKLWVFDHAQDRLKLLSPSQLDSLSPSQLFVCRRNENGTYSFVTPNGKFLIWKGTDDHIENGANENTGNSAHYDAHYCDFRIEKLALGAFVKDVAPMELLGKVSLTGKRALPCTKDGCFVMGVDGKFNQADVPFYTDQFSSALVMKEMPYYNQVALEGKEERAWGTIYLPFAAEVPEGVTAHTAQLKSVDGKYYLLLKPLSASIVPANTPVILTALVADDFTLIPAIQRGEMVEQQDLKGTLTSLATTDKIYRLDVLHTPVAFTAVQAEKLPMGSVYVAATHDLGEALPLSWNAITGMVAVEQEVGESPCYDIQGRRLRCVPSRGIYIQQHRKWWVK